jgi:hypothetical protein
MDELRECKKEITGEILFKDLSYQIMKATNLQLGILINFGTPRVQYFRIANSPKTKRIT